MVPRQGRHVSPDNLKGAMFRWMAPDALNRVSKIASWPQKKKASGLFFKAMGDMYSSHRKALELIRQNVSQ
jgi:hypothetical protein